MWEMSLHERLDFWLLLKPWETRHVHVSLWQQMVAADWQGELSDLRSPPSPAPHQPPCLLYLQCFWAIGVWISLFYFPFLNVLCLPEEPWAIPSCYPPNNASRDCSQEDERCRNTGFGGRLTRVQRPQEMSRVIAVSLPGESQRQPGPQVFSIWSFHNSVLCSPHFFSLFRSLLNLQSALLFHPSSYFPTRTECFPYRAFGLGWELLLLSMTNGIFSLLKTIQNQQDVKCICKVEKLFFDFCLFVCQFHWGCTFLTEPIMRWQSGWHCAGHFYLWKRICVFCTILELFSKHVAPPKHKDPYGQRWFFYVFRASLGA